MARKSRRTQRLRVVNPDCAGIDIGKDRHFVAVDPERTEEPVRSFGAFTRDLEEMAAWLASCGVTKVAMESTSVYWIPVYETLERAGFEVMLVPPRMTKQIGGRKSDVLDCQWIWQLMSYGLLRGAFRPGDEVCPLRSYARQMRRLTGDRSRCVLHMQKALTEMNVKLDSVIANITGLTGQRILRAIIDGERDPERLATLRHRGIKADADTIAASLQGTWREEHLFALEQAMQRYDFLTQQIDDCEARVMAEIERLTPPDDLSDGGAPDHAPGTTSETASSRSANAASNDTGQGGHPGPGVARNDGRRPHRDPHHRSRYRTGDRLGVRPGLLRLPLRPALLLLACARAVEPGSAAARTSPASPRRRSTPSGRPCAWRPWPRAAARPSSAPSTAQGSPEWTPPLRSRRPPANSPA